MTRRRSPKRRNRCKDGTACDFRTEGQASLEEAFELKSEHVSRQNENGSSGVKNEAVQALVALGYASSEALKALNGIEITDDMDVETLLKAALKNMAFL